MDFGAFLGHFFTKIGHSGPSRCNLCNIVNTKRCPLGSTLLYYIFLSFGYRNIAQGGDPLYMLGQIRNGAAEAKLYQVGPVFLQKKGGSIYFRARLFFGVMSVTLLGPGNGFPKMRGVSQK